jgi:hypothetical protein
MPKGKLGTDDLISLRRGQLTLRGKRERVWSFDKLRMTDFQT